MKSPRLWMFPIFAALASVAFFASKSDATPETVQKITDGVWFREGDLKNMGHCNNIIIEMKDYLILPGRQLPQRRESRSGRHQAGSPPSR